MNLYLSVSVELGISTSARHEPGGNFSALASTDLWKYPSHFSPADPFLADMRNSWLNFSWYLAFALRIVSSPFSFSMSAGYFSSSIGLRLSLGSVFWSTGWSEGSRSWTFGRI